MMRAMVLFLATILVLSSVTAGQQPGVGYSHEKARGLWDEEIDFANYRQGPFLMHSYTPLLDSGHIRQSLPSFPLPQ